MRALLHDLRYAARVLAKSPGFTAVAVLTLALGIGANTAIFSVVDAVLLRPLPYGDPTRLVTVGLTHSAPERNRPQVSIPQFESLREASQSFDEIAASRGAIVVVTGGVEPEQIRGRLVTARYFSLLETKAAAGRTFTETDAQPGGPLTAVISHGLAQRRFGAPRSAVGQSILLNGQRFTVAGVLPPSFRDPYGFGSANVTEVWTPITPQTDRITNFNAYQVLARLDPNSGLQQAQAEMDTFAERLAAADPDRNAGLGVQVVPLQESIAGAVRPRLLLLLGAVGFVLLIACANVANLLLARATNRRAEMAVRATLGASRARLVCLALTESLLLAAAGAALGVLCAAGALQILTPLIPASVPRTDELGLDYRLLSFAAALALATGLLFGLIPALRASRVRLSESIQEGARSLSAGRSRQKLTRGLAIAEVALALVLLAAGGLMLKSFWQLSHVDPGFRADQVLTFQLRLPAGSRTPPPERAAFYQQLLEQVETLPEVQAAAIATVIPLAGSALSSGVAIEGEPPPPSIEEAPHVETNWVSTGYFRALGLPLLQGREFTSQDISEKRDVVIVSDTMAKRYWPNQQALGKRIRFAPFEQDQQWKEVIGVVAGVKFQGLETAAAPQTYEPYSVFPPPMAALVVRHAGENIPLIAAVKQRVWSINNDLPIHSIQPMEQVVSSSISQPRFYTALLSLFASLGVLLAIAGVYGVLHYAVSRRTHEFGVRMALGASRNDVLALVMRQALGIVLPGLTLGLAASTALTRLIASELFEVSPTDPLVLGGLSLALAAAAVVAAYLPARRATRVHPVSALRYE
jgi:putative ABC transport system permease protein